MKRSSPLYLILVLTSVAGLHADEPNSTSKQKALLARLQLYPHAIVYETYCKDNWELFAMNADGSGKRNLTNTPDVHELYPQASPDGTKICFLADMEKDEDTLRSVYFMNADGTSRTKVAEKARQPCWNVDGRKIAYLPQEFKRFNVNDYVSKGLNIYDLKTGKTTPHPNTKIHHLYNLNWSPDGNWFVSTVHGGMGFGHANLALAARGDQVTDLKIRGCRPCVSNNGKRVTWSSNDHTISVADLDLKSSKPKVSNITVVDHRKKLHLYHPDFSPDGKYITYSVGPGGRVRKNGPGTHTQVAEMVGVRGKWNICLRRADGKGPIVQLTDDEDLSSKESEWIRRTPFNAASSGE